MTSLRLAASVRSVGMVFVQWDYRRLDYSHRLWMLNACGKLNIAVSEFMRGKMQN
jgi:hypothetical protein